jgi:hypothetical protein
MNLDLATELWMAGIILFGVGFYFLSFWQVKKSREKNKK